MDLVPLRFATGKDFLRANKTTTRILHRTRASFPRGEEVVLDIAFPGLDVPILVRAVVAAAGTSTAVIFRPLECEKDTWRHLRRVAAGTGSMSRSHVRYPAEVAVDCRSRDGRRIRARCRDLSVGGVSVDSSACPDVGTRIRVAIGPLADGSVFLAYGLVAWVGDSSFGVRFLGPTSAALRVALRRASETGRLGVLAAG
ncbi:MAG: PilZ domain-containing protein [Deltaproteobacteria bacterium]|nr:PilZ domain-containing protein [Deltaproteobacteria bacterium]